MIWAHLHIRFFVAVIMKPGRIPSDAKQLSYKTVIADHDSGQEEKMLYFMFEPAGTIEQSPLARQRFAGSVGLRYGEPSGFQL